MFFNRILRLLCSVSALGVGLAAHADAPTKLKLISAGATEKLGTPHYRSLSLSTTRPAGLKKLPKGIAAPLYGVLNIGNQANPTRILILLDEKKGKESHLYVDANHNGDLTDDPKPEWKAQADDEKFKMNRGGAYVQVGGARLHLGMLRFDPNNPERARAKASLYYFSDYAYEGTLTLGDAAYHVVLTDDNATGDFRGSTGRDAEAGSGVRLLIDVNGNGRFDRKGESFDIARPFNIKGTTYEVRNVAAIGGTFEVVKSDKTVAEIPPPVTLGKGKPALAFEAKTTDGNTVRFPSDFKGKLVMLEFWATWSAPCCAKIPDLVKAYNKYHNQNFEILGISLDKKGDDQKLADFTQKAKMPWAQVFDGKYWQSDVAQLYVVEGIPRAYLIDGDTGQIVAEGEELSGESLDSTLKAALDRKNKQ